MANDRIWMVCSKCKEKRLLFKYYPNGNGYIFKPEKMQEFLNEHLGLCHNAGFNLRGDPGMVLETESLTKSAMAEYLESAGREKHNE